MLTYVADFETTVPKPREYAVNNEGDALIAAPDVSESTRVWAYGICEIGNVDNFIHGTDIADFIAWCKAGQNKLIYFHNLKFDGEFIFYWLLTNGYRYSDKKESKTFSCLVSDTGYFYAIEIIFEKKNRKYKKVTFHDSLKKLPFSVDKIGKDFKLPVKKLDVPDGFYEWERPLGHVLTEFEIQYLKQDVQVIAMALGIQFEQELTRMTIGSDALHNFKSMIGKRQFERLFPVLPTQIDRQIRYSYKGGYTYVAERFAGKNIDEGIVYDVNSLYPSVMYYDRLPYGMPLPFIDEYEYDDFYPLYIQKLTCEFELKEGYIPTVQIKNGGRFKETEYLKSSRDALGNTEVTLVLTNVDLELMFEHYDVNVISYEGGWKFKECQGVFNDYIDHWTEIKVANSGEKNALYSLAKLMLNNLYGKFATNPEVAGKYPYLNEKGHVSYLETALELRDPVYTAMGSFITAYARLKTISTAQAVYDRFIYADTDSIHLLGTSEPEIETHDSELGKWAWEGTFKRARFLRAKTYAEDMCTKDGKPCSPDEANGTYFDVKCAGMPDNVKEGVTWENFQVGLSLAGKLMPKHVAGGIILRDTYFTII